MHAQAAAEEIASAHLSLREAARTRTKTCTLIWSITIRANRATLLPLLLSPDEAKPRPPGMFGPLSAQRDTEKPAPNQWTAQLPSWNLGFGSCFGAIHGLNDQNMGKTASSHSTLKRCRSTITSSFSAWRLRSATGDIFFWVGGADNGKHRPLPYLRIRKCMCRVVAHYQNQ